MTDNCRSVVDGHRPDERLHEFLLLGAELTPDRPAVTERDSDGTLRTWSYAELGALTDRYTKELDALGLDIGDRVLLESSTSACAIAALCACSALGLAFVPVSPEEPAQRLAAIADIAAAALLLRADGCGRADAPPDSVGVCRFDREGIAVERAPAPRRRRRRALAVTDTAYVIFTSGTTGRPKGVVMSHRAVVSFYRGMLTQDLVMVDDRVATTSPLQFDFSLLDIGLALGSGATVVPVPRELVGWPRRLLGLLEDTRATQVNGVPSIWRRVLRHEPERLARLTALRGVLFCGEPFPAAELRALQAALPTLRLVNCYGATESMACSFEDVPNPLPEGVERLSIGFAHPGAEMLLVGEDGRVLDEIGEIGEIHVRSPALFTGYWGDPRATAARLVPDPLDPWSGQVVLRSGDLAYRGPGGELYFVGRADLQVKIRGNRVELGEVESRLTEHPLIAGAAALLADDGGGGRALTALLVLGAGASAIEADDVRAFCLQALPGYMVPELVRVVEELPVTARGKLDRAALAALVAHPAVG